MMAPGSQVCSHVFNHENMLYSNLFCYRTVYCKHHFLS